MGPWAARSGPASTPGATHSSRRVEDSMTPYKPLTTPTLLHQHMNDMAPVRRGGMSAGVTVVWTLHAPALPSPTVNSHAHPRHATEAVALAAWRAKRIIDG